MATKSPATVYRLFRETPEEGASSYLYDHYQRGLQGVMRPERGKIYADAAWRAGHDTAKERAQQ